MTVNQSTSGDHPEVERVCSLGIPFAPYPELESLSVASSSLETDKVIDLSDGYAKISNSDKTSIAVHEFSLYSPIGRWLSSPIEENAWKPPLGRTLEQDALVLNDPLNPLILDIETSHKQPQIASSPEETLSTAAEAPDRARQESSDSKVHKTGVGDACDCTICARSFFE